MGKRTKAEATPQAEKFKRVARELGCDEDEAAFDRALKQMKPPPEKADKAKKDTSNED